MTSATSRQPPRIAPRAWRTVIRKKVLTRPVPRLRATSSWPGSAARKLAAAGRNTSGYRASVITTTAPRKPCAQFHSEAQPKLITKSGIASGTTISTTQTRRPGSRVRSVNQAAAVPITAQATVTVTVSRTVFHSSSLVRPRKISRVTGPAPALCASISRNTSGTASTAATAALSVISTTGRRGRRARGGAPAAAGPGPGGRVSCPAALVTAGRPGASGRSRRTRHRGRRG